MDSSNIRRIFVSISSRSAIRGRGRGRGRGRIYNLYNTSDSYNYYVILSGKCPSTVSYEYLERFRLVSLK